MKKILFQGDSITDARRSREDLTNTGFGYPALVQSTLGTDAPGEYEFINRGVSGDRSIELYARIKIDLINIKPDYLSILIGVNDVWRELDKQNGIDAEKYFKLYSMLIEEVKEALPDTKIMIMEPFVMKGSATEEQWEEFSSEVKKRAVKAREIAEKYHLKFLPLQARFDEVEKLYPANYWLCDGVHPTNMGHEIIKREWLKAFEEIK